MQTRLSTSKPRGQKSGHKQMGRSPLSSQVGTGGTISGVGRYLKSMNPNIKIVLADPLGSRLADLINKGQLGEDGSYLVEGIGSSVVPEVFDPSVVDFAVTVSDAESFGMAQRLVREEGLLVGGSAGTSVVAAMKAASHIVQDGPIVALLQDSWDRYWSRFLIQNGVLNRGYNRAYTFNGIPVCGFVCLCRS